MQEGFLQAEVRDGYAVTAETKAFWAVQLELLEQLQQVCQAHSLKYYAVFGTLLGAVRHGGFIPWDDDIDLAMPRADYDKLAEIGPAAFQEPYYLESPQNAPQYAGTSLRLCHSGTTCTKERHDWLRGYHKGCHIAILPIDNAADDWKERRQQAEDVQLWREALNARINWQGFHNIIIPPQFNEFLYEAGPYNTVDLREKLEEARTRYNGASTRCYGFFGTSRATVVDSLLFSDTVYLPFEHLTLPAPVGYEGFLQQTYWDLSLPEEGNRIPPHKVEMLDINRPYREFEAHFHGVIKKLRGKRVLLFGTGNIAEFYLNTAGKKHPPLCLFDNAAAKWGQQLWGLTVHNPAELPSYMDGNTVVVLASTYFDDIGPQLEALGVTDYVVYIDWKPYDEDGEFLP